MTVNLGTAFEQELIALAGWDPATIDSGSTVIDFLNSGNGQTTVRATVNANVDSDALRTLIVKYGATETTDTTNTPTITATATANIPAIT